jgi:hypothetical protein
MFTFLAVIFSFSALADSSSPAVGDKSRYSFKDTVCKPIGGCAVVRISYGFTIGAFDEAGDRYRVDFVNYPAVRGTPEYPKWYSRPDLLAEYYGDPVSSCAAPDRIEIVTVPAGTFQACRAESTDGKASITVWKARVPFLEVRRTYVSSEQNIEEDLVAFAWAKDQ